jgi:glutathione synthase/RimK-type ligase-like ATP-grasp enzyme
MFGYNVMTAYILRRNHWGEEACKHIQEYYSDLKIINKDKETIPTADWCIRWATTSDIPGKPKVINKAKAIHTVYNKANFRKTLADAGLAPKTVINTYPTEDMYPVVLRHTSHGKSEGVFIAENKKEFDVALKKLKSEYGSDYTGFYASSFVDKDRELRAFIVSGRLVALLDKITDN